MNAAENGTGESGNWLARQRDALARVRLAPDARTFGRVARVADGVAHLSGLPDVALDETVRFASGATGYVRTLDAECASVVLLDGAQGVEAGERVERTGAVLQVPVGECLLGRVIDPLGRPLDRGGPLSPGQWLPVERPAPAIVERAAVSEPLETGVLIVDALFAIGRGQRELIIGDRATGKTSLAVDAIVNQRASDVICVYVAVGQRATAVLRVIDAVRERGAPQRCVFVVAPSSASPGMQWIAPFAGFSVAEDFRDRGQHALVVIDDLSKHAATHRELALLTGEPPGREAYPGDIFYLHARLLERAAKLGPTLGGGSLTALPIAETDAGNLSAYIPTNLISITDGQLVMDAALFASNQRPAVNVGLSVSRVGGKAQTGALRRVAGPLRLDYAQFLELEMFTRFGGLTDARVSAQIARGERIRALLAQPRFSALGTGDQVTLLAALAEGVFDAAPVNVVAQIRERLAQRHARVAAVNPDDESLASVNELREWVRERMADSTAPGKPGKPGDPDEPGRERT
ncbi:ATP synthase subunit alpha [Paraburkholderia caffeinitolerans]|uniref:ATP synthase subunit alpha n=1 Tax=Paraburkholderia caffeinitolerans TaxID=1723730 RepID=A0A6J5G1C6_9BURK|nr:ATP synthase subunit alpha [Paraburkholderia caffeinitolerans]